MISLNHYLFVSGVLFATGLVGVEVRRNILAIYMCLALPPSATKLPLFAFSRVRLVDGLPDYNAQARVVFTITVAAAEVAVGLAISVALVRAKQRVDVGAVD